MIEFCLAVIALCEVIRLVQNAMQLHHYATDEAMRKDLNNQFIESLSKDNSEFVKDMLKAYEEAHEAEG